MSEASIEDNVGGAAWTRTQIRKRNADREKSETFFGRE